MSKIRKIVSFEKLDPEVKDAFMAQYPEGWKNHIQKLPKPNGEYFYAVSLEFAEYSYLIKMDVKIDSLSELEKEDEKQEFEEIPEDEMEVEFDDEEDYENKS